MACKLILFSILAIRAILVDSLSINQANRNGLEQTDQTLKYPSYSQLLGGSQITQYPGTENINNIQRPLTYDLKTQNQYDSLNPNIPISQRVTPFSNLNGYQVAYTNNKINYTPDLPSSALYSPAQINSATQPTPVVSPAIYEAVKINPPYDNTGIYAPQYTNYQPGPMSGTHPIDSSAIKSNFASDGIYAPDYANKFDQAVSPTGVYDSMVAGPQSSGLTNDSPTDYVPWPVSDNKKFQPLGIPVLGENNVPPNLNAMSIPASMSETPDMESSLKEQVQVALKLKNATVPSQPPAKSLQIPQKHYIVVHENGTYEQINNLDDIVLDELNRAHIITKEPPNLIVAIVEIEEVEDPESLTSLESPYDTGITKIPINPNWIADLDLDLGQNNKFPQSQTTTEVPTSDMTYLQPEYLIPIQASSEDSTRMPTSISQLLQSSNSEDTVSIPQNTSRKTSDIAITKNVDYHKSHTTEDTVVNKTDITLNENSANFKPREGLTKNKLDTITNKSTKSTTNTHEHTTTSTGYTNYNNIVYKQNTPPAYLQDTANTGEPEQYPNGLEQSITGPIDEPLSVDKQGVQPAGSENAAAVSTPFTNEATDKPIPITKPSPPEKKSRTSILNHSPIIRGSSPLSDDTKVEADEGIDVLNVYNVYCSPMLIERVTKIHHYENGTETVEYAESLWDSVDAEHPREIKAKREIRDAK